MARALGYGKTRAYSTPATEQDLNQYADLRTQCFLDFGKFIREFFPGYFWGDFSPMHQHIIDVESKPNRRGFMEAIAAPRGNAKTVFKVTAKVIHSIVYGYEPFTVVMGYSAAEAEAKVKDIRDELLYNEELIKVYGKQLHDTAGVQGFVTRNGCMVLPRGRGGQIRGLRHGKYRPTHIVLDDVEDLEACQSQIQRQKAKDWLTKDVMPAGQSGDEFKVNITFVGTILHEDSLLANTLKDSSWQRQKYKAVIEYAENTELWDKWRDLYNNLDDPDSTGTALKFFEKNKKAMLKGARVLWPDGESYYDLMVKRLQLGEAAFNSEKQNTPFDPARQILHPDRCHRFRVFTPQDPEWLAELGDNGFAILRLNDGKAVHSRDLKIIAWLDPALGKKPTNGKSSNPDYAALVVCAQDLAGYIYVLDVWLKKQPPSVYVSMAFAKHEKWGFSALYLETNNFQVLLKQNFIEEQKLWPNQLRVIGWDQYHNKHARISTLQPYFENRWIYLPESIDEEFMNQLRLFPTVHDDGPDALQGCVSQLRRPVGNIGVMEKKGVI